MDIYLDCFSIGLYGKMRCRMNVMKGFIVVRIRYLYLFLLCIEIRCVLYCIK